MVPILKAFSKLAINSLPDLEVESDSIVEITFTHDHAECRQDRLCRTLYAFPSFNAKVFIVQHSFTNGKVMKNRWTSPRMQIISTPRTNYSSKRNRPIPASLVDQVQFHG